MKELKALEQIITEKVPGLSHVWKDLIKKVAYEYAHQEVKKYLEIAAEEAEIICGGKGDNCLQCMGGGCEEPIIKKESITDIKIELT